MDNGGASGAPAVVAAAWAAAGACVCTTDGANAACKTRNPDWLMRKHLCFWLVAANWAHKLASVLPGMRLWRSMVGRMP